MGSKWAFGDFYPTIKVTRRRQNKLTTTCFFQTKELTKSQFAALGEQKKKGKKTP